MTTVAILAAPPREGLVLSALTESTPLSPGDAADLYAAALKDVVAAAVGSGGDPLVNFRPDDTLPEEYVDADQSPEEAIRSVVADAVEDPDDLRFEEQVGSTEAARVGNTITHLLREEAVTSAAVVRPSAALLGRTEIDNAAMKLRRSPVVLGPGAGEEVYYAGFAEPIDFDEALATPELVTLTERGVDAGHDVDYLPAVPTLETPAGLLATVTQVRARLAADRPVPAFTAEAIRDLGLDVDRSGGEAAVVVR